MTFWKQRAAQEALQDDAMLDSSIDVVSPEEDVEAALLEVENDTQEIENHDIVAEYQDEDAQETEERLESLDAEDGEEDISEDRVELIAAAQESIRRRHGITGRLSVARECLSSSKPRRVVARESLWEDVKAFFRMLREWFVEKMGMLKDRWIKFSNAGKTIQAKSKKFDAVIGKLGQKDKDTIKGGFIALLTVKGAFDPKSAADSFIEGAVNMINSSKGIAEETGNVVKALEEGKPHEGGLETLRKLVKESAESEAAKKDPYMYHYGDNYAMTIKEDSYVFDKVEGADTPSDVPTPSISELRSINTLYNKVGVKLEKSIQEWRQRASADEKAAKALKTAEEKIDKIEADEKAGRESVSAARATLSHIRSALAVSDRIHAHNTKCVTKGLNGYIVAGIGAYKKSKA